MVLKFIPEDAPIVVAVDDTLNRKTGPPEADIWAAGMHHDPLLSTAKRAVFSFGHNWVVLSVQLRFPFAPDKIWSLPILMSASGGYRRKQKRRKPGGHRGERKAIGQAPPTEYRTRPQLASEMIALLVRLWRSSPDARLRWSGIASTPARVSRVPPPADRPTCI